MNKEILPPLPLHLHEVTFRNNVSQRLRIRGLNFVGVGDHGRLNDTAVARLCVHGGSLSVEANIELWNRGLDPRLTCPDRSEIIVIVERPFSHLSVTVLVEPAGTADE